MKNEIREKARDLYAHSNLTKTQIAAMLGISRTSLHGWVREGNWDRLRAAAEHLPSILAENATIFLAKPPMHTSQSAGSPIPLIIRRPIPSTSSCSPFRN